jgi:hypothetical protein
MKCGIVGCENEAGDFELTSGYDIGPVGGPMKRVESHVNICPDHGREIMDCMKSQPVSVGFCAEPAETEALRLLTRLPRGP